MRIVGGTLRGRKLYAPRGQDIRPTSDRVRESLFNILGIRVIGAEVLDVFAGTGALGLEALSRGAVRAVFIDDDPRALAVINRNITALGLSGAAVVIKANFSRGLRSLKKMVGTFDLIFLDPPYTQGLVPRAMKELAGSGLIRPGALAAAEHAAQDKIDDLGDAWLLSDRRVYGRTVISFFIHKGLEVSIS